MYLTLFILFYSSKNDGETQQQPINVLFDAVFKNEEGI